MGETHELVTSKYRVVTEQVGHHPPETAYFMDSENYEQFSCTKNSASFNGRYLIIAPKNNLYINLKLPGGKVENYSWTVPQTAVHNLLIGKMYVDIRGHTRITNHTTGDICDIEWKERTWSGKNANCYEGIVKNPQGIPKFKVWGNFTEEIYMLDLSDPNAKEELMFRIREKPANSEYFYNFSLFAM